MDLVEFALTLGKDIPKKYLKDIKEMADRKVVMQYCKRFPDATTKKSAPAPKTNKKLETEEE